MFASLVVRSGCHLKRFNLEDGLYFGEFIEVDDLCNFLQKSPSLIHLGEMPIPPAVFRMIGRGELLLNIKNLQCSVKLEGIHAFLDLMEQFLPGQGIQKAHVWLDGELGHEEAEYRYGRMRQRLLDDGRDISVDCLPESS